MNLLEFKQVNIHYQAIQVIHGLSFYIRKGEVVSLIGANGAGKTTILKSISGLIQNYSGEILYEERSIRGLKPHEIVRKNISQAPEGRGIFLNLTVEENIDLGAWTAEKTSYKRDLEHGFQLFPRLKERRRQLAGTLSGGEQQMLAMARALMSHPKLLLLDEPSLGLAPQVIERIFEIIQKLNKEGMTILLVEQNASQALRIADRGIVLERGRIQIEGSAATLLTSDAVRKAYLGD